MPYSRPEALSEDKVGYRYSVGRYFSHVAVKAGELAPFRFDEPMSLEIRFKRIEAAEAASRGLKLGTRVDPYTVRRELQSLSDYF